MAGFTPHSSCYDLVFRSHDWLSTLVPSTLISGFPLQEGKVKLLFMCWLQSREASQSVDDASSISVSSGASDKKLDASNNK